MRVKKSIEKSGYRISLYFSIFLPPYLLGIEMHIDLGNKKTFWRCDLKQESRAIYKAKNWLKFQLQLLETIHGHQCSLWIRRQFQFTSFTAINPPLKWNGKHRNDFRRIFFLRPHLIRCARKHWKISVWMSTYGLININRVACLFLIRSDSMHELSFWID